MTSHPLQSWIKVVTIIITTVAPVLSELPYLNSPGNLDEVGTHHPRQVVPDDSVSPGLALPIDQFSILVFCRSLILDINILAYL